jgi:hypothetical protein
MSCELWRSDTTDAHPVLTEKNSFEDLTAGRFSGAIAFPTERQLKDS